ncbi:lysis protein [Pseudomonas sp. TE3610]
MTSEHGSATGIAILALMLMGFSGTTAWVWQANRYEKQLAVQRVNYEFDLSSISSAGAAMLQAEQVKRLALESELAANDQEHHKDLRNAPQMQARLRDCLATSDLRLSLILYPAATIGGRSAQSGALPAVWFMEPQEPNLPQRMLNELLVLPEMAIED